MKKNILLLSRNLYLIAGIKSQLTDDEVRFFERDEIEYFIHMCSSLYNQRVMVIYDKEDSVIVKRIFGDFSKCLVSSDELKSTPYFQEGKIDLKALDCLSFNLKKSRAHEIVISFYYLYLNYTYDKISKKISMDKRRISYVLTNYVRSQNYNNKNLFYIDNVDVNDSIQLQKIA